MDLIELFPQSEVAFGFNTVFKLLFFVIIVGYILYSFLLLLRVRILSETISTKYNKTAKSVAYINLIVSLVGGFLALLLVLLA